MKQLIVLLLFLFSSSVFSQRTCGSMQKMNTYFEGNPDKEVVRKKKEKAILYSNFSTKENMNIPVVFHVVYNTSEQNISDAQILSQLDVMNDDFNRTNSDAFMVPSDFDSVVAGLQLNFCLAKRTPDGDPTNGIIRTQTNISDFDLYDTTIHYSSLGGSQSWDTEKYLNIWVTKLSGGILGWAQFPAAGSIITDGIVIDYRNFGTNGTATSPYHLGRTVTHELGHYFNLFHIWGDNNCGDDLVNDTPTQQEANFGCKIHPSISCSNNGDMFMNFMDYTNDSCMNSFTIGQRNRVFNSIYTYRLSLLSSDGCTPVITNTADASIEITYPIGSLSACNNPIYPKVLITNNSNANLYTAVVKYKANSSSYQHQLYSGNLSQGQSDTLLLSAIPIGGNNHYLDVELIQVNGSMDSDTSNNSDTELFNTTGGTSVNIHIITDNYANETSWYLYDVNNTLIDFDDNLNNKLAVSDYLFNTGFKDVLNRIPNNDNSSIMTFRTETGEWNKYCCNPTLLSQNGIQDGNDNTNYMTRNPIYGNESDQQKNNNNCVVNHDSRLNIYNKLLDIRKLFYTSQLFKTDSAKEEIENIQKETIVEEVCLDTMGNNSELIQAVLSDITTSESSEFVLSSDTKTKIDVNYKNLFDKISENYDYYKSDDITLDQRKNHLIELGKRFFRKGYEIYNYCISGVEPMNTSTEGGNLSMVGGASGDPLKEIEWITIKNHFLFNCIVEYLINIHFEKYFLEYHKKFTTITKDYIPDYIPLPRGFYNSDGYDSTEYVDHFHEFLEETRRIMMENRGEASAFGDVPQEYIDYEIQTPIPPIPKLSDFNMYMDLFDSPIYSFPITKDFKDFIKNAFQSPTQSPNKKTTVPPVTASPAVNVPEDDAQAAALMDESSGDESFARRRFEPYQRRDTRHVRRLGFD